LHGWVGGMWVVHGGWWRIERKRQWKWQQLEAARTNENDGHRNTQQCHIHTHTCRAVHNCRTWGGGLWQGQGAWQEQEARTGAGILVHSQGLAPASANKERGKIVHVISFKCVLQEGYSRKPFRCPTTQFPQPTFTIQPTIPPPHCHLKSMQRCRRGRDFVAVVLFRLCRACHHIPHIQIWKAVVSGR